MMTAGSANAQKRTLKLYFLHTKERAEITYKVNGKYIDSGLNRVNRFLRDWRRNEPTKMDPQLLDLLWEVYQKSGSRDYIHVVSAYRSPATNKLLRSRSKGVAKNSQHTLGKAIDYFIPDVKLSKVREIGLKMGVGGVGYYPTSGSPFVHMDTGRVRHWPRMTRKQLVKIFPRGNTLHVPTDGKPLPGYDAAVAQHKAKRARAKNIVITKAEEPKKPGFFERLALARKQRNEEAEKETAVASAAGPNQPDTSGPDSPPLPALAPRNPGSEGGTELQLASLGPESTEDFSGIVPVPSKRPSLRPTDRLLAETRELLVAARANSQTTEASALSPGEIESLRRNAVANVEPARFASVDPQPVIVPATQTPPNQSQASLFAISSPAQAGTPIAAAPATREPELASAKPPITPIPNTRAPRPQNDVPVFALLDENSNRTELRASVGAANSLIVEVPERRSTTGPKLARPIPAAGLPSSPPQSRDAIENVEYGYTGAIASIDQDGSDIGTTTIEGPSNKTLQLALAATVTDSSASQAIRALVDSRQEIEAAILTDKETKPVEPAVLEPMDDELYRADFAVPEPRPVPPAQAEQGQVIAAATRSAITQPDSVVVPMPQTAQRGYLGKWALASEVPIGMISSLSAPTYGKQDYLNTKTKYLMAGFAKTGPRYQPGRISAQIRSDMSRNFTR